MKILFISSEPPYPVINGLRIKLYNVMRLMSQEHQIALITFISDSPKNHEEIKKHLGKFCEKMIMIPLCKRNRLRIIISSLVHRRDFYLERYYDYSFLKALERMNQTWCPDVIHFDAIIMSQYGIISNLKVAKVVSPNDSYSLSLQNELKWKIHKLLWKKIYTYLQYKTTQKYESDVYPVFNYCHVVSNMDAIYLKMLNPAIQTMVIPNGVDVNYFKPLKKRKLTVYKNLIFVAQLGYGNSRYLEDFLINVWSIVKRRVFDAQLIIIGRDPPLKLQNLGLKIGGVVFKGYVKNLRNCYSQCMIALAPIRKNCGILNKILEGMAMGLAVIGFRESFAGIPEAQNGENCIYTEDENELISEIINLLEKPSRAIAIGNAARKMVENNYSWETRKKMFSTMYQKAIQMYNINK